MKADPALAYQQAITKKVWDTLPKNLQPHVAYRFDEQGFYSVNQDCFTGEVFRSVNTPIFSHLYTNVSESFAGIDHFEGKIQGVKLDIVSALVEFEEDRDSVKKKKKFPVVAAKASSAGNLNILWLNIRFSNQTNYPNTTSEITDHLNEVASKFAARSYGISSMTYEALDVTITSQTGVNGQQGIDSPTKRAEANAAAVALGKTISDYSLVLYRSDEGGNFTTIGNNQWIMLRNTRAATTIHEIGHTMGLQHANYWRPEPGQPSWGSGDNMRYLDVWDDMGAYGSGGDYNVHEKKILGWFQPSDYGGNVFSGTYRIYPFASA